MQLVLDIRNWFVILHLLMLVADVTSTVAQVQEEHKEKKSKKRQTHSHHHKHDPVPLAERDKVVASLIAPVPPPVKVAPAPVQVVLPPPPQKDPLEALYPDVRACYDDIPRIYQKAAAERLGKRLALCQAQNANTTSLCHKHCILLHLNYLKTYVVSVVGSPQKHRRIKIDHEAECGHNMFGQDLLGIDTKIWDEQRAAKQRKEKALYYEKVNEIGIGTYDSDPFRLKFATQFGEDIVDERLEAQMRICRLYDLSVADVPCEKLERADKQKLEQLVNCIETALTCR